MSYIPDAPQWLKKWTVGSEKDKTTIEKKKEIDDKKHKSYLNAY